MWAISVGAVYGTRWIPRALDMRIFPHKLDMQIRALYASPVFVSLGGLLSKTTVDIGYSVSLRTGKNLTL